MLSAHRLPIRAAKLLVLVAAATFGLPPAQLLAYNLTWNAGAGNFVGSQTWSYDNGGVVATTDNPFTHPGPGLGGENLVLIGNGGVVTLNTPDQGPLTDNSLYEIRIGTNAAEANLTGIGGADLRGDGTLTVENVDLLLFDTDGASTADTGRLIIGGANAITGTVNWNSTGTLNANGHLRIGQSGTGILNQTGGTIRSGTTVGTGNKDMHVGNGGGDGTLNLNDGVMELGTSDDGAGLELRRTLHVGTDGGTMGTFHLGDGVGAAGSASFETWSTVNVGSSGGTGVLNVNSDGELRINYASVLAASSPLRIGPGNSNGTINQTGGVVDTDGLLELGFNTGTALYNLTGSTGTVNVRALTAFAGAEFAFNLDGGGATTINVEGNTNPTGDVAAGNSISLSNSQLTIGGLNNYTSTTPIVLFEQLDATAALSGSFGNFIQGQSAGLNGNSVQFYLNYFGGDGNDVVLQSTLPASSTDGLVWNVGPANFDAGWAAGDSNFGAAPPGMGVDPFAGLQNLYLGKNGVATYDGSTNDSSGTTVKNLHVGTNRAAAIVAGTNGNGTLTVAGSESLTVDDSAATSVNGVAFIGDAGFTGTLNWNSTGTFNVQGQLRVGRAGGTGVLNQNAGIVQAGTTGGGEKYLSVGDGAGSGAGANGTYNLNNGTILPDGLGAAATLRQFRVGIDGATGVLNVGDGVDAAGSALFESEDDLWVGSGSGNGAVSIKSDGSVRLLTTGAEFLIGRAGGTGLATQDGGTVTAEGLVSIGAGANSVGEYRLNAGTMTTGTPEVRIGAGGGTGTFRIQGSASFTAGGNLFISNGGGSGAVGLLELTGSDATFQIARLENAPGNTGSGNNETIRWVADAGGVTPIVINGATGTAQRVQLQDPAEVALNTGVVGSLMGDGIALSLDLSALSGNQTLTLIDNQTAHSITGFFENAATLDLYESGDQILGTGYSGSVTISYGAGAGGDVLLNLVAGAVEDADFDGDGDVDGSDFLTWQRGLTNSGASLAQGDANADGAVNGADLQIWRDQFGPAAVAAAAAVPEPLSLALATTAACLAAAVARRRDARV